MNNNLLLVSSKRFAYLLKKNLTYSRTLYIDKGIKVKIYSLKGSLSGIFKSLSKDNRLRIQESMYEMHFYLLYELDNTITYAYLVETEEYRAKVNEGSLVISSNQCTNKYILVPHVDSDPVLERYKLPVRFAFSILKFKNRKLTGIKVWDKKTHRLYQVEKRNVNNQLTPRILQAPVIALYAPELYMRGLREMGYHADYMIHDFKGNQWLVDNAPTFDLELLHENLPVILRRSRNLEFLLYAVENYDVFHLHSNYSMLMSDSLWEDTSDLYFLKSMGKKIVMGFWGWCDVAPNDKVHPGELGECAVCKTLKNKICKNEQYQQHIKNSKIYSDKLLGNYTLSDNWIDNPIDTEIWKPLDLNMIPSQFRLPATTNIRIYHSFGNSDIREDIKGSRYIKEAIDKLRAEGYQCEAMIFDRVDHINLKYYQMQADIVVDQLLCGWHGSTGVECMAVGKPVITHLNPIIKDLLPEGRKHPLIDADCDSIYSVLKDCLSNMEKMRELGKISRKYVEQYHDYRVVAKQLSEVYQELINNRNQKGSKEQCVE